MGRLGVLGPDGGWVHGQASSTQHLPGGLHTRHPFPRSSPFPQSESLPLLFRQQGCYYSSEQSARESQCTGCPHLSACGQSPRKKAVQGQRPRALCLKEKDNRAGRLILQNPLSLSWDFTAPKKTTCKEGAAIPAPQRPLPGGTTLAGREEVLGKASLTALTPTLEKSLL